jgi:putative transposase
VRADFHTTKKVLNILANDSFSAVLLRPHVTIETRSIRKVSTERFEAMGLVVLRTPVRAPQANACCERLIGTIRRECVDFVIPMNERHLRAVLRDWCSHYNRGRPHASLGPGIPERPLGDWTGKSTRHRLPDGYRVAARPILGGLHHEYHLEQHAA